MCGTLIPMAIRVNPNFRRRSIGTELIKKMIQYGKEQGAKEAAAVVSVNNIPSQAMMEKSGFVVISRWNYYSTTIVHQRSETEPVRIATLKDMEMIRNYLKQSQIFMAAAESYVDFWRWYHLVDLDSGILQNLVDSKRVIVSGIDHSIIKGLMIINKYNSVFQIGYLDACDVLTLRYLVRFVFNLAYSEETKNRYEKLQIFSPQIHFLQSCMKDLAINEYGQFLLYKRDN
jgi:hypothetical protein